MNKRSEFRAMMVSTRRSTNSAAGFSLIELMVAMLLGLIVIGGVISVFLANQQTYRTNEALSDVQDGTRVAFELMAQDIRNAGLTGCDSSSNGSLINVLKASPGGGGTAQWWANWNNAVIGYGSGTAADPAPPAATPAVAGNDSLQLIGAANANLSVLSNTPASTTFTLNEVTPDLLAGDALIVCDPDHSAIFQAIAYNLAAKTVTYPTTTSSPGNYSSILSTTGIPYTYGPNALIAKLAAVDWYIGATPGVTGGLSLYRVRLSNTGGSLGTTTDEMVRNVTSMKIIYLLSGATSFVSAATGTNWSAVTAVQVQLTLRSTDQRAGTNGNAVQALTHTFTSTTTVRNRVN